MAASTSYLFKPRMDSGNAKSEMGIFDTTSAETAGLSASEALAWYCARTKPKNEHIAAANVRRSLGLEVFHPRLRSEQVTCRGVVKNVTEPLFPCYIFVRCVLSQSSQLIRHTFGVSSLVNFGFQVPTVPDPIIEELKESFGEEETMVMNNHPIVGDDVTVGAGAFFGMRAVVLRSWPAKRRVQILLDILGRPTPIEVHSSLVTVDNQPMARMLPSLALGGSRAAV